jgi:nicotinamide-nucleotide amidase
LHNTFTLPTIEHMTMVVLGIPESLLSRKLEDVELALPDYIKLAYLPAYNVIRLRLTGHAEEKGHLRNEMEGFFDQIALACGEHVLVRQDVEPMTYLCQWLMEKNISIAAAESCSGGMIAQSLVRNAGISAIYNGSINSYSNEIKVAELGVKTETLAKHGAVSEECALEMALGARIKFGTQLGISTTGIAGPSGATEEKKVGLIYLGITDGENHLVKKLHLFGNRTQFMERNVNAMAYVIHLFLQKYYRSEGI